MKFTRMLSIAVVAMFAFAAFAAVIGNTDSSDAETKDYDYGAYVKLTDISQADFEKYNTADFNEITMMPVAVSALIDMDVFTGSDVTVTYKYDKISYTGSEYASLKNLVRYDSRALETKITNLTVTITFNNTCTPFTAMNGTFDGISEVIKYINHSTFEAGEKIVIKCDSYRSSVSRSTSTEYKSVPNETDKYVISTNTDSSSLLFSGDLNVEINGKTVVIDNDLRYAYKDKDSNVYCNTDYALGSIYADTNTDTLEGYSTISTIKANGIDYKAQMIGNLYGMPTANESKVTTSTVNTYKFLPASDAIKYNDVLRGLNADNAEAEKQIKALNGECSLETSKASSFASDVYNNAAGYQSSSSSNDTLYWIILGVILVILLVAIIFAAVKAKN